MTFEGTKKAGVQEIMTHLTTGLKFQAIKHEPKSMEVQFTGNSLILLVSGDVKVDGGANGIKYSETFNLFPTDASATNFWVKNSIFSLNYG